MSKKIMMSGVSLLAVCAVAALVAAPALAAPSYKLLEENKGVGTPLKSFKGPGAVATNCSGDVYVADGTGKLVDEFSSSGVYMGQLTGAKAPAKFGTIEGIAVNCSGDLYVADFTNNVVDEFSSELSSSEAYIGQIHGIDAPGGSDFKSLSGLALNGSGDIYVSEENDKVVDEFSATFSSPEDYIGQITGEKTPNGKFAGVTSMAVSGGDIYVIELTHKVVDELSDAFGSPEAYVGQVTGAKTKAVETEAKSFEPDSGIAVNGSGEVYVADETNKVVDMFNGSFGSGEVVTGELKGGETVAKSFGELRGLAVSSSNGYLYVADKTLKGVDTFEPIAAPAEKYTLTIEKEGSEAANGWVFSHDTEHLINCGTGCSASFSGTVTLSAWGLGFSGWGPGCKSEPTARECEVEMTEAKTIEAKYNMQQLEVTKEGTGEQGWVFSTETGEEHLINCGTGCSAYYPENTKVVLHAYGLAFSGWEVEGGSCEGTTGPRECEVTLSAARKVKAKYDKFVVSVAKEGAEAANGWVFSTEVGEEHLVNCGTGCAAYFEAGTTVIVHAWGPLNVSAWDTSCSEEGGTVLEPRECEVVAAASLKAEYP